LRRLIGASRTTAELEALDIVEDRTAEQLAAEELEYERGADNTLYV